MISSYVAMVPVPGANFCVLEDVENLSDPPVLRKGQKIAPWPPDVRFHMDPNFPKATQLADCISNLLSAFVASKSLKDVIESLNPPSVEYLRISIVNHRGKVASDQYFVINPYELQDCIDKEASTLMWNRIDTDLISACEELVIDESRIDPNAKIFRLKHYPNRLIFRRDVADELQKKQFTGLTFIEISEME